MIKIIIPTIYRALVCRSVLADKKCTSACIDVPLLFAAIFQAICVTTYKKKQIPKSKVIL